MSINLDKEAAGTVLCIGVAPVNGDGWYVRIWPDGTLDYSEGYTPDEAADTFWESIAQRMPRCTCGAFTPAEE